MWLAMLLLLGAGLGIGGLLLFSRRPEEAPEFPSRLWSDADQLEDSAEAADPCDAPAESGDCDAAGCDDCGD